MKKLFASLLAATMVAGMAVSAFAYTSTTETGNDAEAMTYDYFFGKNLYDKNGKNATTTNVKNDYKIYIPILSKENVVDENKTGTDTVALTKYSEVEKLTVKVKDKRNGKYLKDAAIVSKDLDGATTAEVVGTEASFKLDLAGAALSANGYNDTTVKLTIAGQEVTSNNITGTDASGIANAFNSKTVVIDGVTFTASVSGTTLSFTSSDKKAVSVGTDATVAIDNAGTDSATLTQPTSAKLTDVKGEAAAPAKGSMPKMYYAELKVGDYFLADEDEFEFDLELRNKGRKEDVQNYSWTIGKDIDDTTANKGHNTLKLDLDKLADKAVKFDDDIETIILKAKDFEYEVKAAKQGAVYLDYNTDITKPIVLANPEAELNFVNFPGKPEFDFTGTFKYYVADDAKEWFFYEIVDGKPVATNAKYNKEDACFELRTRTLGSYVISDKALVLGADTETTKPEDKPAEKPATGDKVVGTGALC